MTLKRTLVFVPFDDILEEVEPLSDLLWFSDYSFKDLIVKILTNINCEEGLTFDDVSLDSVSTNLYGKTLSESIIEEYYYGLELQDRCNSTIKNGDYDELLLQTVIDNLVHMVEEKLKLVLRDTSISDLHYSFLPFWNFNRIVLTIKSY